MGHIEILEEARDKMLKFRVADYNGFWPAFIDLCGKKEEDLRRKKREWNSLNNVITNLGYEPVGQKFRPKWESAYRGEPGAYFVAV